MRNIYYVDALDQDFGCTLIESSYRSLAYFKSRQYLRFINEIRPNRLDTVREHVISEININLSLYFVRKISFVKNM